MKYYELNPSQSNFQTLSIQTTYKCQQHCANCYLGSMLNDKAGRMNSDNVWLCKDISTCSRNDFSSAKENVCSKIVKRLQETLN